MDGNQAEIVELLRAIPECSVCVLSAVGDGCPDLLVGYRGFNFLFEVKDPSQPKHRHELTDDQRAWHGAWSGQVRKVFGLAEIVQHITGLFDEALAEALGGQVGKAAADLEPFRL